MGLFDQVHHLFLIGSGEGVVISRTQLSGPGVEHLHHLGAGINLITEVVGDGLGEVVEQFVQQLRLAEGHGLDHRVVLAAFAFHHVGSQGPGCTDEAQHGGFIANALAQTTQHLTDEGHGGGGIQGAQGVHLIHGADRITDLRPLALDDVEIDAHPRQRREDVGKQNHAIGFEGVKRLHGDLVGEIRVLGAFAEAGVLVAQIPVDLHVTPGLTHHPHGRTLHRFTAGCTQKQGQSVAHQAEIR